MHQVAAFLVVSFLQTSPSKPSEEGHGLSEEGWVAHTMYPASLMTSWMRYLPAPKQQLYRMN
jgi:hypothetical protein